MKKDVKDIIKKEEIHLNNLLEQEDLSNRYPTRAAKYWQCVREQSTYLDNLMSLSFDYRRNEAKIKWLENKIKIESDKEHMKDEYKLTKYEIDLDEAKFAKASMEKVAKHRMREIKMWSKLKSEFNDGSFNDKDVNQHQLESYGLQYHEKAKTLNENSSEAEIFNVMGQLNSLQRIKKSGELESSYTETEKLTQHGKPKI